MPKALPVREPGVLDGAGDPEVQYPGTVVGHDDVAGFEIAVHQTAAVDRHQRLGQRGPQAAQPRLAHRPLLGEELAERFGPGT